MPCTYYRRHHNKWHCRGTIDGWWHLSIDVTTTIDCKQCLSMDIACHNRLGHVCMYRQPLPTAMDCACYPSIVIVGDNGFQAKYFSTFLSRQYVGRVTYRYKLPTVIFGETCLSIAVTDDNRPVHCTIFYCYCNVHSLLPRVLGCYVHRHLSSMQRKLAEKEAWRPKCASRFMILHSFSRHLCTYTYVLRTTKYIRRNKKNPEVRSGDGH